VAVFFFECFYRSTRRIGLSLGACRSMFMNVSIAQAVHFAPKMCREEGLNGCWRADRGCALLRDYFQRGVGFSV